MHDDSVLVAIDEATRTPPFCTCGKYLAVVETVDAMWLECPTFAQPTRLPAALSSGLRSILHERRFVVEIPEALRKPAAAAEPVGATSQVSAVRA